MARTFGVTTDCNGCRYWSEMMAQSIGGGPITAMCLNSKSEFYGEYKIGRGSCSVWASGEFGAIDEPGQDETIYQEKYKEDQCQP